MKALHQLVPSLQPGDAVSGHALEARRILREMGVQSEIYVEGVHADLRRETRHFEQLARDLGKARGEVGVMYQMAIGSKSADVIPDCPGRKLLNYHNITPARFFRGWDPHEAMVIQQGRRQLAKLAEVVDLAVAVSAFNERELIETGYAATTVAPVLFDPSAFEREMDGRELERLRREQRGAAWLFVGRTVPHKAQHDVVKAFAVYRRLYDPDARLHLVGGGGPPAYREALAALVSELDLGDSVDLAGRVSQGALAAYYEVADVFVCLSEHEGFGIPLLEAMHHRLPVVAYDAGAVPETVEDAAVVLPRKSPARVAAAVDRVLTDPALRQRMVARGLERLDVYTLEQARARFVEVLAPVIEGAQ